MPNRDTIVVERERLTLGDLRNIVTTTRDWNPDAVVDFHRIEQNRNFQGTAITITDNNQENTP